MSAQHGYHNPPQWVLESEIHDWRYWPTTLIVLPLMAISIPALSILVMVALPVEPVVKVYVGALLLGVNVCWACFVVDG